MPVGMAPNMPELAEDPPREARKLAKAMFLMRKYFTTEAAVSNVVWHLLDLVGANDDDLMLL